MSHGTLSSTQRRITDFSSGGNRSGRTGLTESCHRFPEKEKDGREEEEEKNTEGKKAGIRSTRSEKDGNQNGNSLNIKLGK